MGEGGWLRGGKANEDEFIEIFCCAWRGARDITKEGIQLTNVCKKKLAHLGATSIIA